MFAKGKAASLFTICLISMIIMPALINCRADWCIGEGESSDGYNPIDCFADQSFPNANKDPNMPCCSVIKGSSAGSMDLPIPGYLKEFVSYVDYVQNGKVIKLIQFDYGKFVKSGIQNLFLPIALPVNFYDAQLNVVLQVCFDTTKLSPEQKIEGFPLFTMSYARFGEDLTPPSGHSIEECDLCMNTIYVRPDAFPLFECAKDGKKQLWPSLDVYKSIEDHNITKAQHMRRLDGKIVIKNLGITPNGMMCPFAPKTWKDFNPSGKVIWKEYVYLPLHFLRPDKLHVWDETLIPINETQPPKGRIGKTIEFPSPSMEKFFIRFPSESMRLLFKDSDEKNGKIQ